MLCGHRVVPEGIRCNFPVNPSARMPTSSSSGNSSSSKGSQLPVTSDKPLLLTIHTCVTGSSPRNSLGLAALQPPPAAGLLSPLQQHPNALEPVERHRVQVRDQGSKNQGRGQVHPSCEHHHRRNHQQRLQVQGSQQCQQDLGNSSMGIDQGEQSSQEAVAALGADGGAAAAEQRTSSEQWQRQQLLGMWGDYLKACTSAEEPASHPMFDGSKPYSWSFMGVQEVVSVAVREQQREGRQRQGYDARQKAAGVYNAAAQAGGDSKEGSDMTVNRFSAAEAAGSIVGAGHLGNTSALSPTPAAAAVAVRVSTAAEKYGGSANADMAAMASSIAGLPDVEIGGVVVLGPLGIMSQELGEFLWYELAGGGLDCRKSWAGEGGLSAKQLLRKLRKLRPGEVHPVVQALLDGEVNADEAEAQGLSTSKQGKLSVAAAAARSGKSGSCQVGRVLGVAGARSREQAEQDLLGWLRKHHASAESFLAALKDEALKLAVRLGAQWWLVASLHNQLVVGATHAQPLKAAAAGGVAEARATGSKAHLQAPPAAAARAGETAFGTGWMIPAAKGPKLLCPCHWDMWVERMSRLGFEEVIRSCTAKQQELVVAIQQRKQQQDRQPPGTAAEVNLEGCHLRELQCKLEQARKDTGGMLSSLIAKAAMSWT